MRTNTRKALYSAISGFESDSGKRHHTICQRDFRDDPRYSKIYRVVLPRGWTLDDAQQMSRRIEDQTDWEVVGLSEDSRIGNERGYSFRAVILSEAQ